MKYTGDSLLGVSFSVKTPKPLDCRTVVDTTQELYTIPAEIAYEGMSVSNLEDGYIYMLVDKTNITNSDGWVASYKALQLISCTEAEYTEWKKNTTEQGTAIDSEKPYLHNDTYYYIYEDSIENKDTYYVNQEQYQRVWNLASSKADNTSFLALQKKVESNNTNITTNYLTKEDATNTYVNKSFLEGTTETTLKEVTDKYQTAETSDSKYLKPSNFGVSDINTQFSFLNTTAFEEYKATVTEQLGTKITKNSRATLESLMVNTIQNTQGNTMSIRTDGIFYGAEKLAKVSEVPKWMCLSQEEYKQLESDGTLQDDTYYLTYGNNVDDSGFVTADLLERQVKSIMQGVTKLQDSVTSAETANKNAIDGEVTRAKGAEKLLQDQITELGTSSSDALNSEITNRTEADKILKAKIDLVSNNACKVVNVMVDGVSVVTDKIANINLSSKAETSALSTEISARENADTTITTNLDNEITRASSEEQKLKKLISDLDTTKNLQIETSTADNTTTYSFKQNNRVLQSIKVVNPVVKNNTLYL